MQNIDEPFVGSLILGVIPSPVALNLCEAVLIRCMYKMCVEPEAAAELMELRGSEYCRRRRFLVAQSQFFFFFFYLSYNTERPVYSAPSQSTNLCVCEVNKACKCLVHSIDPPLCLSKPVNDGEA